MLKFSDLQNVSKQYSQLSAMKFKDHIHRFINPTMHACMYVCVHVLYVIQEFKIFSWVPLMQENKTHKGFSTLQFKDMYNLQRERLTL